jgi:predicted RND superfamily exporter protein
MVRSFALLLILGIAIAFLLALTAGFAALSLRPRGIAVADGAPFWRGWRRMRRGAGDDRGSPAAPPSSSGDRTRARERALSLAVNHPRRVLGIGLILAVAGWALGTQISTQSDIRKLAPQSIEAVRELNRLQEATGVSGEIDVKIEAPDLTDPATLEWMAAFKHRVLRDNGFTGAHPTCLEAEVCPGPALSDFVGGGHLRRAGIRAALRQLPEYDLRQVAPVDPATGLPGHLALISFGIRAQSLDEQQALIERVRSEIGEPGAPGGPPTGVGVRLAGLPVVAAAAANDLDSSRYWVALAGLLAVALLLLVVYRSIPRALVPLAPVVLAGGWSTLVLWASGIPLNPMSAALGALTIAIATEFSVILSARFHEERAGGSGIAEALEATYARTGAAVLASGLTATAGFAVLIASDIHMLRDFGLVTVVDLAVALLGVMVALPAALALWGRR